ncbi:ABC transporter substrate-binding protein [Lachnospiraceae bacterium 54-53]
MKLLPLCLAAVLAAAGVLTGCSSADGTNSGSSSPAVLESADAKEERPAAEDGSGWPRTITDASGRQVVLETCPRRIAILHSMYLEYFFALETPPAASAGSSTGTAMDALREWETLKPYAGTAEILDLGSSRELNLEAVLEAEPDVIVTFQGHGGLETVYDQLTRIAPVILLDYQASWQEQTMDCAQIIGKEEEAGALIAEVESAIAGAREKILAHGEETVALFRTNGGKSFVTRGDKDYYETFGLTKPAGYPDTYETLALEAVMQMDPDYIIFQDFLDVSRGFVRSQEESAVWNSLTAVKNGNVVFFDDSFNTFGPLAMKGTAEKLVKVLYDTAEQEGD